VHDGLLEEAIQEPHFLTPIQFRILDIILLRRMKYNYAVFCFFKYHLMTHKPENKEYKNWWTYTDLTYTDEIWKFANLISQVQGLVLNANYILNINAIFHFKQFKTTGFFYQRLSLTWQLKLYVLWTDSVNNVISNLFKRSLAHI
jgi:hypothetical protein